MQLPLGCMGFGLHIIQQSKALLNASLGSILQGRISGQA